MRRTWARSFPLLVLAASAWIAASGCGADDEVVDTSADARDDGVSDVADADADADADVSDDSPPEAEVGADADADTADDDGTGDLSVETDAAADEPTPPCSPDVADVVVNVTVTELHDRIAAGGALAVVDVREPGETAGGIIAGALLDPWSSGVLAAEHGSLPADRPLYVICAAGSRSPLAAAFLVDNGHHCVNNVQGGMSAWRTAGYPTASP